MVWTPASLRTHLSEVKLSNFRPKSITFHHTGAPNLATRPQGLKIVHIENMRGYYRDELGWSAGPHLFVDEDQLFGMTPFDSRGVHAVEFNSSSIGIEVLGDYDSEDPKSGRGLQCWENAFAAGAAILDWLGLPANSATIKFHCEDPSTKKTCPGSRVTLNTVKARTNKDWVISGVARHQSGAQAIEQVKQAAVNQSWAVYLGDYRLGGDGATFQERGGRVAVPVRQFITAAGLPVDTLLRDGEGLKYKGELVEDAFLASDGITYAPIRNMANLLGFKLGLDTAAKVIRVRS